MNRRAFICGGMAAILASRRAPAFCVAMRNGMTRPSAPPTPPLPYDYAVEYIETDGVASYIDTGIAPIYESSSISLSFKYASWNDVYSGVGLNTACGASPDNAVTRRVFSIGTHVTGNTFATTRPTIETGSRPPLDKLIHDITMDSSGCLWDGVLFPSSASLTFTPSYFCLGTRGPVYVALSWFGNVRFYSCKIYTNNVLMFDGIPVVTNGVAGMYDSISGTVKTNAAATGTITAGPRRAQ